MAIAVKDIFAGFSERGRRAPKFQISNSKFQEMQKTASGLQAKRLFLGI
jgi:hypothetical protein